MRVICLGGLLLCLPTATQASPASVYTVTSTLDNPDASPGNNVCADTNAACTLRAAVMEANAHAGPDLIVLPADTFQLTRPGAAEDAAATGDLDLSGPVTLQGAGAAVSIIDAAGLNDRVVDILAGAQASLSDLTIRGGTVFTDGVEAAGGGLRNAGSLTLTHVIVTRNNLDSLGTLRYGGGLANWVTGWLALNQSQVISNEARYGAGIVNAGQLTIDSSQVLTNSADMGGGVTNYGQLTVNNSLISGNYAYYAGGLSQENGATAVFSSTIRANQAAFEGGGLRVSGGMMTVTASTLSNNSTSGIGGGVKLDNGTRLTAVNTTIVLNSAAQSGGGVNAVSADFAAYNVTIAGNLADADDDFGGVGGGLYGSGSGITLSNTLLADNWNRAGPFDVSDDCYGIFGTFRYSLVRATANCTFTNDHTLVGVDPHLLSLAANGGPTLTMALGPGSAALDAGDPAGCAKPVSGLLLVDQRGRPRPVDGNVDGLARCDIGAYEAQLALFFPLLRR